MNGVEEQGESVTLDLLKEKMADFAKERDWDQFHSPRNLLLALVWYKIIFFFSLCLLINPYLFLGLRLYPAEQALFLCFLGSQKMENHQLKALFLLLIFCIFFKKFLLGFWRFHGMCIEKNQVDLQKVIRF